MQILLFLLLLGTAGVACATTETHILTASDGATLDNFGKSVAIDGTTILVGADFADPGGIATAGAVYVFDDDGAGGWTETAKLVPGDLEAGDSFGHDVAIAGDTLVAGAPFATVGANSSQGAAYVYTRSAGVWTFVKRLEAATTIGNLASYGEAVAIDGDTIVIGASGAGTIGNPGQAFVYSRNEGGTDNWGQVKVLEDDKSDSNAIFGTAVAVQGDLVVVGAPMLDITSPRPENEGAVYLFGRDEGGAGNWGQLQRLQASDFAPSDNFGRAVGLDGTQIVVGAPFKDGTGTSEGGIYVFDSETGAAGSWTERARWDGPAIAFSYFGDAVAVRGDIAVFGASGESTNTGKVYLHTRDGGGPDAWAEADTLSASDGGTDQFLGEDLALGAAHIVVGAWKAGSNDEGAAYAYAAPVTESPTPLVAVPLPGWSAGVLAASLAATAAGLLSGWRATGVDRRVPRCWPRGSARRGPAARLPRRP